jgi:hypothetical protein
MKKAVIILSAIALLGCNQTAQKKSTQEILQYGGIYSFGNSDKTSETAQGTVYIYPETDSTFLFYLYVNKGAPSYNSGSLDGRAMIKDNNGIYSAKFEYAENACTLYFEFKDNTVTVQEDDSDCGFGHNVYADGTFLQKSAEIPEYYTNVANEKIYFNKLSEIWKKQAENQDEDRTNLSDCDDYTEDDGYTQIRVCTFENKNLQQVYEIAKKADVHLKQELPTTDIQYTEDETIEVSYQYKSKKHLWIEVYYAGGVTTIEIVENKDATTLKTIFSAD